MFERYVNFEFYKTVDKARNKLTRFERYVNFEFYKTDEFEQHLLVGLRDM